MPPPAVVKSAADLVRAVAHLVMNKCGDEDAPNMMMAVHVRLRLST